MVTPAYRRLDESLDLRIDRLASLRAEDKDLQDMAVDSFKIHDGRSSAESILPGGGVEEGPRLQELFHAPVVGPVGLRLEEIEHHTATEAVLVGTAPADGVVPIHEELEEEHGLGLVGARDPVLNHGYGGLVCRDVNRHDGRLIATMSSESSVRNTTLHSTDLTAGRIDVLRDGEQVGLRNEGDADSADRRHLVSRCVIPFYRDHFLRF